jgi:hypothetical protein
LNHKPGLSTQKPGQLPGGISFYADYLSGFLKNAQELLGDQRPYLAEV